MFISEARVRYQVTQLEHGVRRGRTLEARTMITRPGNKQ